MERKILVGGVLAISSLGGFAQKTQAALTLTPAGVADNFGLSVFANGFPNANSIGPLGIAFTSSGGVMVTEDDGAVRIYPADTDGNPIASAPPVAHFGNSSLRDFAQDGKAIYVTSYTAGTVLELNQNGTFKRTVSSGYTHPLGLEFNPHTGHLILGAAGGLHDLDPVTGTDVRFSTVPNNDGIALSADGNTVYTASGGHVLGINVATAAQVFDSGAITGVDGIAIAQGAFAGSLFVNTNDGRVVQVPLNGGPHTVIANGGSRGDFIAVDPHDGSLLLTQTESIFRLTGLVIGIPHPIIGLGTSTAYYGAQITNGAGANQGAFTHGLNALTLTGSTGTYTAAQVTGINGGAGKEVGYVNVAGFNPGTDREVYALDILINGGQATPSQIATLVDDINSTHSYGFGSVVASATNPVPGGFSSLSPSVPYNLYFTFDGLTLGASNFAFDMTQDPTFGTSATVAAVVVVPEPTSIGLCLFISAAVLGGRVRRECSAARHG